MLITDLFYAKFSPFFFVNIAVVYYVCSLSYHSFLWFVLTFVQQQGQQFGKKKYTLYILCISNCHISQSIICLIRFPNRLSINLNWLAFCAKRLIRLPILTFYLKNVTELVVLRVIHNTVLFLVSLKNFSFEKGVEDWSSQKRKRSHNHLSFCNVFLRFKNCNSF